MRREIPAVAVVLAILVLFPVTLFGYQEWRTRDAGVRVIDVVARIPEHGGFTPDHLRLRAGEKVRLRVTSPDVVHGLTIPGLDVEIEEIYPGQVVEVDITPQQAGRYAFACTRWCGADHWRMRGVIDVESDVSSALQAGGEKGDMADDVRSTPLYERLGIDLDAMRPTLHDVPERRPSAARGSALDLALPDDLADPAQGRAISPVDAYRRLRRDPAVAALADARVWDLVAWTWLGDVRPEDLARAADLYARDCAACHGPEGRGDGPAGLSLPGMQKMMPDMPPGPADFADPRQMLSASDAVLHGKILRGGMGTGMPEFGSLYTDAELWTMASYVRTFLFDR